MDTRVTVSPSAGDVLAEEQPGAAGDPGLATTLQSFTDLAYRDVFWPSRRYEDACDRIALRALLPRTGDRLLEVGAGFGRLANEYGGYREVTLLDASEALLDAARESLGGDTRFRFVVGDAFRMPFPDASFDAVVCIRVIHHFEDPRPAIMEFARVLRPGGTLVLESANKRNLKSVIAFLLRRQAWSPFAPGTLRYGGVSLAVSPIHWRRPMSRSEAPIDVGSSAALWSVAVSYLHAPRDLRRAMALAGLRVTGSRSLGLFRLPILTARVPVRLLVAAEMLQQPAASALAAGPSVCYRAMRLSADGRKVDTAPTMKGAR